MNWPESATVIVGAGFTGLFTALHLSQQSYPDAIVLIERNDRFCFKPLLYEYLSGEMEPAKVVPLYGDLLQGSHVLFFQDVVESIDLKAKTISLASGNTQPYKNLVLAVGSVPAFFAAGAEDHALTFQSKEDADRLKDHLLQRLQAAAASTSPAERQEMLTVAIVGGGPVGVELALTLGDLLPEWYVPLGGNPADIRIVLLNRGEILQGDVNSRLRDVATSAMELRRVSPELRLGATVKTVEPGAIAYECEGETLELRAGTIVWAAGTRVHPLISALDVPPEARTKRGHLLVTPTLQLLQHPEVFAAGDCAVVDQGNPEAKPLPPTAQVAYQQGGAIASALKAQTLNQPLKSAEVTLRGTLMKLGLGTGVANLFDKYEISGSLGQRIRQMTYLELLPTLGRNLVATLDWLKDDIFKTQTRDLDEFDYTAGYDGEERYTLSSAITWSAAAVSLAEIGTISDRLEIAALGRALAGALVKYPQNRVIHALFGHQVKRKVAIQQVQGLQLSLEELLPDALGRVASALEILAQKATPEEQMEYRELLFDCCDRVAKAAGSGLLGTGQRVSPQETAVLDTLKSALSRA